MFFDHANTLHPAEINLGRFNGEPAGKNQFKHLNSYTTWLSSFFYLMRCIFFLLFFVLFLSYHWVHSFVFRPPLCLACNIGREYAYGSHAVVQAIHSLLFQSSLGLLAIWAECKCLPWSLVMDSTSALATCPYHHSLASLILSGIVKAFKMSMFITRSSHVTLKEYLIIHIIVCSAGSCLFIVDH